MNHKLGPKGQLVIEKDIRDRLGIGPGWRAVQRLEDDHVAIYFLPPEHSRSLAGSLEPYIKRRATTAEALQEARDEARIQRAKEREAR